MPGRSTGRAGAGARDEGAVLPMLIEYAPCYAKIFSRTAITFVPPDDAAALAVVARFVGTSTTNFWASDRLRDDQVVPVGHGVLHVSLGSGSKVPEIAPIANIGLENRETVHVAC